MSESSEGAKFEVLLDGKPQIYRITMLTAMGAAHFLRNQNPYSKIAVRDLQTGELTVVPVKSDA
jgi:hypothetical protein